MNLQGGMNPEPYSLVPKPVTKPQLPNPKNSPNPKLTNPKGLGLKVYPDARIP